jgi:hypothetical protein
MTLLEVSKLSNVFIKAIEHLRLPKSVSEKNSFIGRYCLKILDIYL